MSSRPTNSVHQVVARREEEHAALREQHQAVILAVVFALNLQISIGDQ